jgi:dTDP-L-rhamnose 4-epimerase
MSNRKVLITGGAGFIGSHLADELLAHNYDVRALDILCQQVHASGRRRPVYLSPKVELIIGDVRNQDLLRKSLEGVDAVFHLAAKVGVGQSMYQPADYTEVNGCGTACLMEEIVKTKVRKLVVASSMSIYGEGSYQKPDGEIVPGFERPLASLQARQWELRDDAGSPLHPVPTNETKVPSLSSIYALSKFDQERMCLLLGRAYRIPTVALRFFNVYGPRQALSNPYTGVLAIFASQLLHDESPVVFEDGLQRRDFVNVRDVARACRLALEADRTVDEVFNIGSGEDVTILDVARSLSRVMDKEHIEPQITGKYRVGDIRHCFADISRARMQLNYQPLVSFDDGLRELADWLEGQTSQNRFSIAKNELQERGLTI